MPHGPQVGAYMQGGVAMINAQSPPTRIVPQGVVTNEQRRIIGVREQRIGNGYGGAPFGMQARGVMGPGDFYGAPGAAFHNGMQVQQMMPMVGMEQRGIAPPSDDVRVSTALLSSLIPSLPPSPSPFFPLSPLRSSSEDSIPTSNSTPHSHSIVINPRGHLLVP